MNLHKKQLELIILSCFLILFKINEENLIFILKTFNCSGKIFIKRFLNLL